MKVLSLYDGMACGMIALIEAGVSVDRYVAYEVDEYAIKTTTHNFPKIEQRGDVFNGDFTEFKGVDILMGGSPCTKWSIAQKNGRETEASGIGWEWFCQYVRALKEAEPKCFIYENNKSMSKAIKESISEAFGFEPVLINSALVSAQNRQRLYWVGKRNDDGTYSKVNVKQPKDRGIVLKDILKINTDVAEPVNTTTDGKSQTIKAQYQKISIANICCYTSTYGASGVAEPVRVGSLPRPSGELSTYQSFRIYSVDGKSVNINSGGGGAGGKTGLYAIPVEFKKDAPIKATSLADGKEYTVYEVKGGLITIKGKQYPIKLVDGFYIIRKLTVRECMRLQTIPEWYEFPVSDSQAYKMLGNGWTVDVIVHILRHIMQENLIYKKEY